MKIADILKERYNKQKYEHNLSIRDISSSQLLEQEILIIIDAYDKI
jgi:hypothetical protein